MDGESLFHEAARATGEPMARWAILDRHRLMEHLNRRAREFVTLARARTELWTAASVEGAATVPLPPGFVDFAVRTRMRRPLVTLETAAGTLHTALATTVAALDDLRSTEPEEAPGWFVLEPAPAGAELGGAAAEDGAESGGRAVLTAAGLFGGVAAGDVVHNLTRGAFGFVLPGGTADAVPTAMGPVGVESWVSGDAFRVLPQAREQLRFSAAFAAGGVLVSARLVVAAPPVFSADCRLDLAAEDCRALAGMAALDLAAERPGMQVDAERLSGAYLARIKEWRRKTARNTMQVRG